MKENIVAVGNMGSGWSPVLSDKLFVIDPQSWGNRKIEAIKKRRAETQEDFATAKKWVEENLPEFRQCPKQ